MYFNCAAFCLQESFEKLIAKAIFVTGRTLNLLEHPLWKDVFKKIRPGLKLPSRKILSGRLLDEEYNVTQSKVLELLNNAKNFALQLDGWSNIGYIYK